VKFDSPFNVEISFIRYAEAAGLYWNNRIVIAHGVRTSNFLSAKISRKINCLPHQGFRLRKDIFLELKHK